MLETVRLDSPKIGKNEYKVRFKELVNRLVVLQQEAKKREIGVVVLFEGWKGAGKGSRISDLLYNLDARDTSVHVMEDFDEDEALRVQSDDFAATGYYPVMQQFWKTLGPRGSMTFYDRGWYSVIAQHVINNLIPKKGKPSKKEMRAIEEMAESIVPTVEDFETQLHDDGYIVIKFFLHISEKTQRERLISLYSDPSTNWRVSRRDIKQLERYDQTYRVYDEMLKRSQFKTSPWILLDAEDKRQVNLSVVQTLVNALERELARGKDAAAIEAEKKAQANSANGVETVEGDERTRNEETNRMLREKAEAEANEAHILAPEHTRFRPSEVIPTLDDVDHTLALTKQEYKLQLKAEQERLRRLEQEMYIRRIPMMIMYEGWDAAGKGGNIKRVAQALDARAYTIFPSPAPTKPELLHPHLWRYWTRLPKAGHVGIYDRSWYGRVLVERVEGFASPSQWSRAYDEINAFERDMVEWGAILLKFWVDVSPETQLERFEAREQNPEKQWKITAEDWRNRDKYPQYKSAVEDMFRLTSTVHAPWTILESDDKYYARVKALRIINEALEKRLKQF